MQCVPVKTALRCHVFGLFSLCYLPMATHLFNVAGVGLPATTKGLIRYLYFCDGHREDELI